MISCTPCEASTQVLVAGVPGEALLYKHKLNFSVGDCATLRPHTLRQVSASQRLLATSICPGCLCVPQCVAGLPAQHMLTKRIGLVNGLCYFTSPPTQVASQGPMHCWLNALPSCLLTVAHEPAL